MSRDQADAYILAGEPDKAIEVSVADGATIACQALRVGIEDYRDQGRGCISLEEAESMLDALMAHVLGTVSDL